MVFKISIILSLIFNAVTISFSQIDITERYDSLNLFLLDQITVTADRFDNTIKDISTKIDIINFEKINNSNGFKLQDKLLISPLVFIKSYGISSSLQTISINGLGASHSIILLDGVRLNSFQNSIVDLSTIAINNIERIEIINNGASSIYGSDAIGGVINLITKNQSKIQDKKSISLNSFLTYGSYNTFNSNLSLRKNFSLNFIEAFISKEKSNGDFDYYFENGIERIYKKREKSSYDLIDFGLNSQIIFNSKNRIKFYSIFSHHFREIPGMDLGTPPSEASQKDKIWNLILTYDKSINKKSMLKIVLNYQNNLINYKLKPIINSFYKNKVYSFSSTFEFPFFLLNNIIGYDYVYATLNSNEIESGAQRNINSLYLNSRFDITNQIKLYASGRFDNYSDFKQSVYTYRAGLNIKPIDRIEFRIKSNIGKNFRAPTFNDLYWKNSGNKALKPENSINKELGLLYQLDLNFKLLFEFTYSNISVRDKIIWLPGRNGLWRPDNISTSLSNNYLFTMSVKNLQIKKINMSYDLGINLINSKKTSKDFISDPSEGKYFPYLPINSIKSNLSLNYNKITINLFYNHIGKRFSDFENLRIIRPINLLDANFILAIQIFDINSSIKFELNNITNTNYQIIPGYPMPLRNFKLTLSINY